jgi:NAD-dependent deacetylase
LNKDKCIHCDGSPCPGVVLFGEILPENSWNSSLAYFCKSELAIVIGSLEVYPASQLQQMIKGKTVYINTHIDTKNHNFDLVIQKKPGEVQMQVGELI